MTRTLQHPPATDLELTQVLHALSDPRQLEVGGRGMLECTSHVLSYCTPIVQHWYDDHRTTKRKLEMPMISSTPKPAPFRRLVVFTSVASLDASS